jgi:hypothetical protein
MGLFAWRDLEGTDPRTPLGAPDQPSPPIPSTPIVTAIDGPWGLPWIDGLEEPGAPSGLLRPSPEPQIDTPDVGWTMPPGAYRGEYRTQGPVQQWGLEPSGGLGGDQAVGRTMRFPVNIPERYDVNGVNVGDYRDLLAGQLAMNNAPTFTDANVIDDLVLWDGNQPFAGWGT